ncbi:MAG: hypothetical protein PHT50_01155 [Candidatus Omnitrophica bacterium]|nr:hypothetical protein [Candidatus Omnitrophota bacterium]
MGINNKRLVNWVLLSSLLLVPLKAYAGKDTWNNIEKSKHFIIYYQDASSDYINRLVREAERCYRNITTYLGFMRFDFWIWDNRCKIFLYPDEETYLGATGVISWSRGHVQIAKKEISTYMWQEMLFDTILPHEMGHIIFREFVGYNKALPLWLDEGVACMQEYESKERLATAKCLVNLKLYTHLDDLSKISDSSVIIPFIFYNESASIVDFLLRRFGRNKFVDFCRSLRDQPDWVQSLRGVYRIKNLDELEKLWVEDQTEN